MNNICIDFGTCNTVISYTDENNMIKHIFNPVTGDILIPTTLYFNNLENINNIDDLKFNKNYIIGTSANDFMNDNTHYYCQFKRFLGITKKTINYDFLNKFNHKYELSDDCLHFIIGKLKISVIDLVKLFMK